MDKASQNPAAWDPQTYRILNILLWVFQDGILFFTQKAVFSIPVMRYGSSFTNNYIGAVDYRFKAWEREGEGADCLPTPLSMTLVLGN